MAPAFTKDEYKTRLAKVRRSMAERELDAMVVGDPSNMNWLTGFDAWSMYCLLYTSPSPRDRG